MDVNTNLTQLAHRLWTIARRDPAAATVGATVTPCVAACAWAASSHPTPTAYLTASAVVAAAVIHVHRRRVTEAANQACRTEILEWWDDCCTRAGITYPPEIIDDDGTPYGLAYRRGATDATLTDDRGPSRWHLPDQAVITVRLDRPDILTRDKFIARWEHLRQAMGDGVRRVVIEADHWSGDLCFVYVWYLGAIRLDDPDYLPDPRRVILDGAPGDPTAAIAATFARPPRPAIDETPDDIPELDPWIHHWQHDDDADVVDPWATTPDGAPADTSPEVDDPTHGPHMAPPGPAYGHDHVDPDRSAGEALIAHLDQPPAGSDLADITLEQPTHITHPRPRNAPAGTGAGRVWDTLTAGGAHTRSELAATAGITPGTTGNLLAGWAADGLVRHTGDRWHHIPHTRTIAPATVHL